MSLVKTLHLGNHGCRLELDLVEEQHEAATDCPEPPSVLVILRGNSALDLHIQPVLPFSFVSLFFNFPLLCLAACIVNSATGSQSQGRLYERVLVGFG